MNCRSCDHFEEQPKKNIPHVLCVGDVVLYRVNADQNRELPPLNEPPLELLLELLLFFGRAVRLTVLYR